VCIGGTKGADIQGVCASGEMKVRIYRVRVYRGTKGTDIQSVCIGGTEGADIQGACVSGGLKVRIYRMRVYRGG